jgi:antitoxin HigA-1
MKMHNPPHPGEVLRSLCLEPLGLTVSPEMAVRLSLAFDTTAESWLSQQVQYDLWRAEKKRATLRVKRLAAA